MKTMIRVGWDWVVYYKYWVEVEDFNHVEWFIMRLRQYARDSLEARYFIDNYPYAVYVIFDPSKYVIWFGERKIYKIF